MGMSASLMKMHTPSNARMQDALDKQYREILRLKAQVDELKARTPGACHRAVRQLQSENTQLKAEIKRLLLKEPKTNERNLIKWDLVRKNLVRKRRIQRKEFSVLNMAHPFTTEEAREWERDSSVSSKDEA